MEISNDEFARMCRLMHQETLAIKNAPIEPRHIPHEPDDWAHYKRPRLEPKPRTLRPDQFPRFSGI